MKQVDLPQDLTDVALGKKVEHKGMAKNYLELIELAMLDKNYSAAKEIITCHIAGYQHNRHKHDVDGYKYIGGAKIECEVKPKTYWGTSKLSMACAFADMRKDTYKELQKRKINIVSSGFNGIHLVYCVEFPFNSSSITAFMEKHFQKKFEGGRRSIPTFNHQAITPINAHLMQLHYPSDKSILEKHKEAINRKVYGFLLKLLARKDGPERNLA